MADHDRGSNGSVLVLAFHFPPENASGAARPYRFFKCLPKFGFDVNVVTAGDQNKTPVRENVVCTSDQDRSRMPTLVQLLFRLLLAPFVAQDSVRWALASYEAAKQLVSERKASVVLSTSPPMISNIVAGCLKARYGIPWIADFRDPLVGNPDRSGSGIRWLRDVLVEKWSFRRADALIANTDAALEMWRKKYPGYAKKTHLIWNGFDQEEPLGPMPTPQRDFKLLVHTGGIHSRRHPGILLSSLHRLIQRGLLSPKKFRVRLIGPLKDGWNPDPPLVRELVLLGCLEYDGKLIPREEAKQAMAAADSLILFDILPAHGAVQVPAKLFEYLRIGRPVLAITTRNSPAERLLSRSGIRYTSLYPDSAADEADRKILEFLTLPTVPVVANDWFWEQFEAVAQTRQLASVIASVCSCCPSLRGRRPPHASAERPG